MPDMMTAYQQATALNDMWREEQRSGSESTYTFFSEQELNDMKNVDYNWLMLEKQRLILRHVLNVSGEPRKFVILLVGLICIATVIFKFDDRFSTRMGLDVSFTKDLKASFNMSYATSQLICR